MKLLKLFSLMIVIVLLSLVIQLPTYLGITLFNDSILLKILIEVLAFLTVLLILYLIRRKYLPAASSYETVPMKTIIAWIVFSLLLEMAINLTFQQLGITVESSNNDDILQQILSQNFWVMMVSLHFIGPVLEEILFRGIFLECLIRFYPDKKCLTIFFSSFIFAFAHTYTLSFHLLGHLVSGLLFSTLYYKTRDLRDSIFAHSVTNILVTILLFVNGLLFQ